jgi:hypothetical protein
LAEEIVENLEAALDQFSETNDPGSGLVREKD